jgi:hypothetical protein
MYNEEFSPGVGADVSPLFAYPKEIVYFSGNPKTLAPMLLSFHSREKGAARFAPKRRLVIL